MPQLLVIFVRSVLVDHDHGGCDRQAEDMLKDHIDCIENDSDSDSDWVRLAFLIGDDLARMGWR